MQNVPYLNECLKDGFAGLPVELILFVVEGLGVGPALDGLLAEQRRVDRKRALLAVFHEFGQVEHRLGYLWQIANHQSLKIENLVYNRDVSIYKQYLTCFKYG